VDGCMCILSTNEAIIWLYPSVGAHATSLFWTRNHVYPVCFPGPYLVLQITRNAPNIKGTTSNSRYSLNLCVHCIRWVCSYYCGVFWPSLFCLFVSITSLFGMEPKYLSHRHWLANYFKTSNNLLLYFVFCFLFFH